MTNVQVFDGAGPDLVQPMDEQGRKHGVWKEWVQRDGYSRIGGTTRTFKERFRVETVYEHGVQVGQPQTSYEGRV